MACCKRLIAGVSFLLSLACAGAALAQGTPSRSQPLDSNMVLLEIKIDRHVLTDSLSAFQFGEKVFLPLGEMANMMTIGIRTYPSEGTARGFIRGDDRPFSLNLANRVVTLGDKSLTFDSADVLPQEDDLYVERAYDEKALAAAFLRLTSEHTPTTDRAPIEARVAEIDEYIARNSLAKPATATLSQFKLAEEAGLAEEYKSLYNFYSKYTHASSWLVNAKPEDRNGDGYRNILRTMTQVYVGAVEESVSRTVSSIQGVGSQVTPAK